FDPLSVPAGKSSPITAKSGLVDRLYLRRYPHRAPALEAMRACDTLLVCGTEGTLLAAQSGRPYIIWPHGGDTMIAAGLLQPSWLQIRSRFMHGMLRRQLVPAYARAICIGSHEPTGICADF